MASSFTPPPAPWTFAAGEVLASLRVKPEQGLADADVEERRRQVGENGV